MIELTDLMLTTAGVGFFLSLLPAIRDSFRGRTSITLVASVPTFVLLLLTAAAVFMLGQVFAASTTLLTASAWAFLAFRRYIEGEESIADAPPRRYSTSWLAARRTRAYEDLLKAEEACDAANSR